MISIKWIGWSKDQSLSSSIINIYTVITQFFFSEWCILFKSMWIQWGWLNNKFSNLWFKCIWIYNLNCISYMSICKINFFNLNKSIFKSSTREFGTNIIMNENTVGSALIVISKFSVLKFEELGLVSSTIIISYVIKVVDSINSLFINNI